LDTKLTKLTFSLLIALSAPLFSGCVAPVTHQTVSGKPEVKISGRSVEEIKSRIRNSTLRTGGTVAAETPQTITVQAVVTDPAQVILFGTQYGGPPVYRVTYSMVPEGRNTVIIATSAIVSNAGTAFETSQNLDSTGAGQEMQTVLNELAIKFSK
jgi:hypothetical protein